MKIVSNLVPHYVYEEDDMIAVGNIKQASLYIKYGVYPYDIRFTDKLYFIFKKEETRPLYDLWNNYELE